MKKKCNSWPWLVFICTLVALLTACGQPAVQSSHTERQSSSEGGAAAGSGGLRRDLEKDESRGGHTLSKHVGRTDQELAERLRREPGIAAASTYTDRNTAERVVAEVLFIQQSERIQHWLESSRGHPNLALKYRGDTSHPIGRSLRRGEISPTPCPDAIVVLKWDGNHDYFVLTSYPDCRP